MKLNIKKLYQHTIHTIEKHKLEIEIAIAALSMMGLPAVMNSDDISSDSNEESIREELKTHLYNVLTFINQELKTIKSNMEL